MSVIRLSDATLRDGSHAIKHQLPLDSACQYAALIDAAGVDVVEVGHGNGLGASSLLLGESRHSDAELLREVVKKLKKAKLGVHIIPGFGQIKKDLAPALKLGVSVIRVASHCTEADTTERYIKHSVDSGCETFGVLMMSHMADKETLLDQAKKMVSYGAVGIILMDSAGCYLPVDVESNISLLSGNLGVPIGFHAHNNLGLAVANSMTAIASGATILDGTASGFGAGAGNAPLEVLIAVLGKMGHEFGADLNKVLDAVDFAKSTFIEEVPTISSMSLVSGLYGVFSGFSKPVQKISKEFSVDPREVMRILGENKTIAGQEDLIVEVAQKLRLLEREEV